MPYVISRYMPKRSKNSRPVVTKVLEPSMLPKKHTQRDRRRGKPEIPAAPTLYLYSKELNYTSDHNVRHSSIITPSLPHSLVGDYYRGMRSAVCTCHVGITYFHGGPNKKLAGQAAVWSAVRVRPRACGTKRTTTTSHQVQRSPEFILFVCESQQNKNRLAKESFL